MSADDPFVTRLREALSRFSDGVHALAPPADDAALANAEHRIGVAIPVTLANVYRFSDGIWLFDEVVHLRPLGELALSDDRRIVCGTAEHVVMTCDAAGRIFERDDDGDAVLSASSMEQAMLVYLAREALLIDAEGEYKDVFGDDGQLQEAVRKRRNEAARKRVPDAARWMIESAELALELDDATELAEDWLHQAVAADPHAAGAQELLGLLLSARGQVSEGARALAAAAAVSGPVRSAERAAVAAAAAEQAGDPGERQRLAKLAVDVEPGIVARMSGEAQAALQAGRMQDADRLSSIVAALAGSTEALPAQLRARRQLRTIS